MKYKERTKPEIFKPLIDGAWVEMAEIVGADQGKVRDVLNKIPLESLQDGNSTSFRYLKVTAGNLRGIIFTEKAEALLRNTWFKHIIREPVNEPPVYGGETEDEFNAEDASEDDNPVFLEHYPEESHEALRQNLYIGGYDADVLGLWSTESGVKIFHAHPEGFWILGEDAIDWLTKTVEEIRSRTD